MKLWKLAFSNLIEKKPPLQQSWAETQVDQKLLFPNSSILSRQNIAKLCMKAEIYIPSLSKGFFLTGDLKNTKHYCIADNKGQRCWSKALAPLPFSLSCPCTGKVWSSTPRLSTFWLFGFYFFGFHLQIFHFSVCDLISDLVTTGQNPKSSPNCYCGYINTDASHTTPVLDLTYIYYHL
jgi:hypothetical protein